VFYSWQFFKTRLSDLAYPQLEDVLYFSYAGAKKVSPTHPLFLAQALLNRLDAGPNDGLVTVVSSQYGTFVGTVELDHFAQMGWMFAGGKPKEHLTKLYAPIHNLLLEHRL
jgi:hypothetical protein